MKKLFYLAPLILIASCAYKSIITATKNKKSVVTNYQSHADTLNPANRNSILTDPVTLDFLKRIDGNSDHGSFQIFIVTDSIYIEAKSTSLSRDSISLTGTAIYNLKQDTLYFTMVYRNKTSPIVLTKLSNNDYTFSLPNNTDKSNDTTTTYNLTKTTNFIIQDNMLELLTGEGQKKNGRRFKYVIINDPSKPDYYLRTIGLIDGAFLSEKDYKTYVQQCKDRQVIHCQNGYDIDLSLNWFSFNITCKCRR